MRHIIINNRGQTMIENLLAMALLITVFYMIVDGSVQLFKADGNTGRTSSEYQMVSQLIETIKGEPAVYQKNFNPSSGNSTTYLATYPYGFAGNILYTANVQSSAEVPKCDPSNPTATVPAVAASGQDAAAITGTYCDGLMAYTIQPSQNYAGLFEGTIHVLRTSKEARETSTNAQENFYYFLINTN